MASHAAIVTYTDRNAFLAALSSSVTDDFEDLPSYTDLRKSITRNSGSYSYTASSAFGVATAFAGSSQNLYATYTYPMQINLITGSPTAVGGYFYNIDTSYVIQNAIALVVADSYPQSVTTASSAKFFWLD